MAYDTQEERLKVRGSEQITRDLKVNRDLFVSGDAKIGNSDVLTTADKAVANGVATLDSTGRVPYDQLPESAMEYKGTWDASTNTPTLADGTGTNGDFYVVSVAGTVTFSAGRSITFYVNDRVIYDGTLHEWERLPAGEVRSVNGQTGDVTLSIPTVVDTVADGNMNAVTSNAVYDNLTNKVSKNGQLDLSGTFMPSTNRGVSLGGPNNLFYYNYMYRIMGLTAISNGTSASNNQLTVPLKSGTLATLDDIDAAITQVLNTGF